MRQATDRQKNVSMEIKEGILKIEEAMDLIEETRRQEQENDKKNKEEESMIEGEEFETPLQNKKRDRGQLSSNEGSSEKTVPKCKKKEEDDKELWIEVRSKSKPKQYETPMAPNKASENGKSLKSGETKTKQTRRPTKPRNDAVIITPGEGQTYAQVLGVIRNKINPADAEADIKTIRKTQNGGILLELGRNTKDKNHFHAIIEKAIGEAGVVKMVNPKITLEMGDLDCLTTKEEVEGALRRELGTDTTARVVLFESNKWEQKMAVVELDEAKGLALLEKSRIKIGWINSRVRRRVMVNRCYRCLGFGHTKRNCKGPDRSEVCWRCGQSGHKASTCNNSHKCFLCTELGKTSGETAHASGTGGCQAFREALEQRKKNTERQ